MALKIKLIQAIQLTKTSITFLKMKVKNLFPLAILKKKRSKQLKKDMSWLTKGDVFTKKAIESYLSYRQSEEILPLKMRPLIRMSLIFITIAS